MLNQQLQSASPSKQISNLAQASADCPCLLGSQIQRQIFLVLVVLPQILASLLVHYGQHTRNRLADGVAVDI